VLNAVGAATVGAATIGVATGAATAGAACGVGAQYVSDMIRPRYSVLYIVAVIAAIG